MPVVQQQQSRQASAGQDGAQGRPVLLATLDVPFDPNAVVFAVDSAVELGARLIVANFVEQEPLPLSVMMGYDSLPYPPEMAESLAEPVRLAVSLGVAVARLRVKSFRPVQALVEVVAEENAGLLVFGPDRNRIRRLRYQRATRVIRDRVTALIWLAD
jgi:nucleotide-binding universal stress UspA family protein